MTAPEVPSLDIPAMLHAFVDGQLDADGNARVLEWLATHPDDAVRVAEWHAQRIELRRLHRALDVGPTPSALAATVLRHAGRTAWYRATWVQAAAAVLLLCIGLAVGRFAPLPGGAGGDALVRDSTPPAFVRDAVVAHAVYTPEQRHPVEVGAAEEAHLVQWLGKRLGKPLRAPSLQDRGFRLLGGRLLPGDPAPRAQFMYENAGGKRMTLYVTVFQDGNVPTGAETAFRSIREGDRESFYWVENGFGYALSADLQATELQALAREVYAQLTR